MASDVLDPDPGIQVELFPEQRLACIPSRCAGETLYGWCSRYCRLSGGMHALISKRLFGSTTAGFVLDFPSRLEYFATVTRQALGSTHDIVRNHTLFPLFSVFRPPELMARVEAMMLGNSVERLKFVLGIPASRASTRHPLKYCSVCASEERKKGGVSHWWRHHQWPTVWICEKHRSLLKYVATNGHQKFVRWVLPDELDEADVVTPEIEMEVHRGDLIGLANMTVELIDLGAHFNPAIMRFAFYEKLQQRGWIRNTGLLNWPLIQESYLTRYRFLRTVPGFEFIEGIESENFGILGPMLRGTKRMQHPTKYFLLIHFLFDSAVEFVECYNRLAADKKIVESDKRQFTILQEKLDQLIEELVVRNGLSMSKAAKKLGISAQRVINWATKSGIPYTKRVRRESKEFLAELNKLIDMGASRESIASELGVRRQWITAFFARNPALRERWNEKYLACETAKRRQQFLNLVERHPGANIKDIRIVPGNPFQWLKRNDVEWLREHCPMFDSRVE